MTLSIMTFSITTLRIMTLSIMGQVTTLSIDIQHNSIVYHYVKCRYGECRDNLNVMLSVILLSVVASNIGHFALGVGCMPNPQLLE
jgi:hypothetical protein